MDTRQAALFEQFERADSSQSCGRLIAVEAKRPVGRALVGRRRECEVLDRLLERVRAGRSQALLVRGEPGVGKSALLEHLAGASSGCRVVRAAGVESEVDLPYAGLHQLAAAVLDVRERLPAPQRDALATAFGLSGGPAPDPFLVGLGILTALAAVAERQPLLCIVDDAHWLDQTSATILGFVARRLVDERVAIVCAARTDVGDLAMGRLPGLHVRRLSDHDALALLLDNVHGPLDPAVCAQIVAESHGNPRALLELPRTWKATELAGGFGLPGREPPDSQIEADYAHHLAQLPSDTRLLVLTAAAEPLGDPLLLHRAAGLLGLRMATANPATDAGVLEIGRRVKFAHPLVRSAAYRSAAAVDRQRVHRALAEATDAATDPDRRAWHRAHATPGPDEHIATELERSAGRAQVRGGITASAAFLQRAVALTDKPLRRAERALAAARTSLRSGAFHVAMDLLATAETGPLDERQRARADLVRAQAAFAADLGRHAPPLFLKAARRLAPLEPDLARETYLAAWGAASIAGRHAGTELRDEIHRAIRSLRCDDGDDPRPVDQLVDGLALLATDGHRAAASTLQRAAKALTDIELDDATRWGWIAADVSGLVWDIEGMREIAARHVQLARDAGALALLPLHLWQLSVATAWTGDLASAASLAAESHSVAAATGSQIAPFPGLRLAALRGKQGECSALIAAAAEKAQARGQGAAATHAHWAAAVLHNGLAHYEAAASAAERATATAHEASVPTPSSTWALPELVEAAARAGDARLGGVAFEQLAATTQPSGNDVALGIEARCHALLQEGAAAEELYGVALDRLGRTALRPELARAHLVYGEWLRREGRRLEARKELLAAHDMFATIGMEAFAKRADRELSATGGRARKRTDEARVQLTPHEEQIALLARDGLSNQEIGTQLFVSARTVEWHLSHVYAKLGISSRKGLHAALT